MRRTRVNVGAGGLLIYRDGEVEGERGRQVQPPALECSHNNSRHSSIFLFSRLLSLTNANGRNVIIFNDQNFGQRKMEYARLMEIKK